MIISPVKSKLATKNYIMDKIKITESNKYNFKNVKYCRTLYTSQQIIDHNLILWTMKEEELGNSLALKRV